MGQERLEVLLLKVVSFAVPFFAERLQVYPVQYATVFRGHHYFNTESCFFYFSFCDEVLMATKHCSIWDRIDLQRFSKERKSKRNNFQ